MSESDTTNKRQRGPNISAKDKGLLVDLAIKYKDVIENKKTDGATVIEKNRAWDRLAQEFNATSDIKRSALQLKSAYGTMKKTVKKDYSNVKVQRKLTGGGESEAQDLTSTDEKLSALMGNTLVPLPNPFDSDAEYNRESTISAIDETLSHSTEITIGNAPTTTCGENSQALTLFIPITNESAGQSSTASSSSNASASSNEKISDSWKNWARRRRPSQQSNPLASQKLEATKSIAGLAETKKKYYEELLTIRKDEKERDDEVSNQKLEALKLKTEYYRQKLNKKDDQTN